MLSEPPYRLSRSSADDVPPALPAASVALAVKLWAPSDRVAVAKLHAAAAVGRRSAEQCGAVVDLHSAAGLGRRQSAIKRIVVGEAVADDAAVGR